MKLFFKKLFSNLPYFQKLLLQNQQLKARLLAYEKDLFSPLGHFYSPMVNLESVKSRENKIWSSNGNDVEGISLNVDTQKSLLKELELFYSALPFAAQKKEGLRYYFENEYYSYTDGIILYGIMRKANPRKIIEIGSGYSSALMLDVNTLFFNNSIQLTFVEPYPDRLYSLINDQDRISAKVLVQDVQDLGSTHFDILEENDILFIDSSHISKTGSDVNYLLFEVLPRLKSGVWIHFHDIFYPFEYPKEWVYEGRNWNEDYIVRAFLMYNSSFQIKLFSHYLHFHHPDAFSNMPLCYKNHGGNLWLQKV